jgi:hypothetical protein
LKNRKTLIDRGPVLGGAYNPLGLLSTKDDPQVLPEVIVTAKRKGSGFPGFYWPTINKDQGKWNDEMYARIRDNKPLSQKGDPSWLKEQLPFHMRNYRAQQDSRKMQVGAVVLLSAPVVVLGVVETVPALIPLLNSAGTAAVGEATLVERAASAGADLTVQLAKGGDIKAVNINSVVGSFVFGNPLAGGAVGNIFESSIGDPSLKVNNPLSSKTSTAIMLSATCGVLSTSLSGSINQVFTGSSGFNEYFSQAMGNYFATGLADKMTNNK